VPGSDGKKKKNPKVERGKNDNGETKDQECQRTKGAADRTREKKGRLKAGRGTKGMYKLNGGNESKRNPE